MKDEVKMVGNTGQKAGQVNAWQKRNLSDLYKECIKEKHDVRVVMSGWSSTVVYCKNCGKVWKLAVVSLTGCGEDGIVSEGLIALIKEIKSK